MCEGNGQVTAKERATFPIKPFDKGGANRANRGDGRNAEQQAEEKNAKALVAAAQLSSGQTPDGSTPGCCGRRGHQDAPTASCALSDVMRPSPISRTRVHLRAKALS